MRTENRVNIFINDKFDFSLDLAQVVDLKLKVGKVLTEAELKKYRSESEFGKLYQSTLEYCLMRPHSIREVRDHLVQRRRNREAGNRQALKNREYLKSLAKEDSASSSHKTSSSRAKAKEVQKKYKIKTRELSLYTDDDIKRVITRLIDKGYLDDAKFTAYYVENRFVKKGISERRLRQELAKKGIEKSLIDQALADNPRDEAAEIQKIINKKRSKYDDEKLIAYLVRQGFDYQQSKDAVLGTDLQS